MSSLFEEPKEKQIIKPYAHQQKAKEEIEASIAFGSQQIILNAPTSFGKEQPYSEPVLTPNGWKQMGDLTLQDAVIGSDGKSKQITHIHEQGIKDVYEIIFNDGTNVRCGADHLWTYYEEIKNKKIKHTDTTVTLMNKRLAIKQKKIYIQTVKPIDFNHNDKLPIKPYELGLLLSNNKNNNQYIEQLKQLNLYNIHDNETFIPKIYLFSSIKNRKQLLYGLLNTDNIVSGKDFLTLSEQLAKDILELIRGLGFIANYFIRTHKGKEKTWRIHIKRNTKYKTIVNIRKLDYKEQSRCITIDSDDHLYVTNNYTLTHNSLLMAMVAKEYQDDGVAILVNISALIDQIVEHLKIMNIDYSILKAGYEQYFNQDKKIQLIMTQTFNARINKINLNLKYLIQDEAHVQWLTDGTRKVMKHLGTQIRIGVSGTPYDARGYMLQNVDDYIETISIPELEEKGFLSPVRYYVPLWSLKQEYESIPSTRDYSTREIDNVVLDSEIINLSIESMLKMDIQNKKTIVFCNSIEHTKKITQELKQKGIKAFAYHSELSETKSKDIINQFRQEGAKITLCAVNRISIGFDVKDIELGVSLRRTNVRSLHNQQIGRLIRPFPGKEFAEFLDLSGNTSLHGFHFEKYSPPEYGELKALKKEREKHEKNVIKLIVKEEPTWITIDDIELKIKEIEHKKHNLHFTPINELLSLYDISSKYQDIFKIGFEIYERLTLTKISQSTRNWIIEPWKITFEDFPMQEKLLTTLLKNRIKKIIKNKKKITSIHYFIDWVMQESDFSYLFTKHNDFTYEYDEEIPY